MAGKVVASEVLSRVQTILQDAGNIRWPLAELASWLSDAMRAVTERYPAACTENVVLDLVQGTQQALPAPYTSLIRAICNVSGSPGTYVNGKAVTPIQREILDAQKPYWHNADKTPYRKNAHHIIVDPVVGLETFWVYPGNDGTGKIQTICAKTPEDIAVTSPADPDDMGAYETIELPFAHHWQAALMHYTIAMAFSKDMQFQGAAERAQAHMAMFTSAVDQRIQNNSTYQVGTTGGQAPG